MSHSPILLAGTGGNSGRSSSPVGTRLGRHRAAPQHRALPVCVLWWPARSSLVARASRRYRHPRTAFVRPPVALLGPRLRRFTFVPGSSSPTRLYGQLRSFVRRGASSSLRFPPSVHTAGSSWHVSRPPLRYASSPGCSGFSNGSGERALRRRPGLCSSGRSRDAGGRHGEHRARFRWPDAPAFPCHRRPAGRATAPSSSFRVHVRGRVVFCSLVARASRRCSALASRAGPSFRRLLPAFSRPRFWRVAAGAASAFLASARFGPRP